MQIICLTLDSMRNEKSDPFGSFFSIRFSFFCLIEEEKKNELRIEIEMTNFNRFASHLSHAGRRRYSFSTS